MDNFVRWLKSSPTQWLRPWQRFFLWICGILSIIYFLVFAGNGLQGSADWSLLVVSQLLFGWPTIALLRRSYQAYSHQAREAQYGSSYDDAHFREPHGEYDNPDDPDPDDPQDWSDTDEEGLEDEDEEDPDEDFDDDERREAAESMPTWIKDLLSVDPALGKTWLHLYLWQKSLQVQAARQEEARKVLLGEFERLKEDEERVNVRWESVERQEEQLRQPESPHEILGVSTEASWAVVKATHRERVKEYHPDRLPRRPAWIQQVAQDRMKKINRAWEILSQAERTKDGGTDPGE